eukprot:ctg_3496.g599
MGALPGESTADRPKRFEPPEDRAESALRRGAAARPRVAGSIRCGEGPHRAHRRSTSLSQTEGSGAQLWRHGQRDAAERTGGVSTGRGVVSHAGALATATTTAGGAEGFGSFGAAGWVLYALERAQATVQLFGRGGVGLDDHAGAAAARCGQDTAAADYGVLAHRRATGGGPGVRSGAGAAAQAADTAGQDVASGAGGGRGGRPARTVARHDAHHSAQLAGGRDVFRHLEPVDHLVARRSGVSGTAARAAGGRHCPLGVGDDAVSADGGQGALRGGRSKRVPTRRRCAVEDRPHRGSARSLLGPAADGIPRCALLGAVRVHLSAGARPTGGTGTTRQQHGHQFHRWVYRRRPEHAAHPTARRGEDANAVGAALARPARSLRHGAIDGEEHMARGGLVRVFSRQRTACSEAVSGLGHHLDDLRGGRGSRRSAADAGHFGAGHRQHERHPAQRGHQQRRRWQ